MDKARCWMLLTAIASFQCVLGIVEIRMELEEELPIEFPELAELGELKNPIEDVITSNMFLHNLGFVLYFTDFDDAYSLCAKKSKDEVKQTIKLAVVDYVMNCLLPPYRQEMLWHEEYIKLDDNVNNHDLDEKIVGFVERAMVAFVESASDKETFLNTLSKRQYTDSFVPYVEVLKKEFETLLEIKKQKDECGKRLVHDVMAKSTELHHRFLDCAGIPRPEVAESEDGSIPKMTDTYLNEGVVKDAFLKEEL